MITEKQYQVAADMLRLEPEMIKAVAAVESNGAGFLPDGRLKILFEPHIFWQELVMSSIRPQDIKGFEDVLYKSQGERPYGTYSAQWLRLAKAAKINVGAAYRAASWGKFQPMGRYHLEMGYNSVTHMVAAFALGEAEQLNGFVKMLRFRNLDIFLREKDFAGFAKRYNGAEYDRPAGRLNDYDYKINAMYKKLKGLK